MSGGANIQPGAMPLRRPPRTVDLQRVLETGVDTTLMDAARRQDAAVAQVQAVVDGLQLSLAQRIDELGVANDAIRQLQEQIQRLTQAEQVLARVDEQLCKPAQRAAFFLFHTVFGEDSRPSKVVADSYWGRIEKCFRGVYWALWLLYLVLHGFIIGGVAALLISISYIPSTVSTIFNLPAVVLEGVTWANLGSVDAITRLLAFGVLAPIYATAYATAIVCLPLAERALARAMWHALFKVAEAARDALAPEVLAAPDPAPVPAPGPAPVPAPGPAPVPAPGPAPDPAPHPALQQAGGAPAGGGGPAA